MMIDFALEAERERTQEAEESIYQACLLRFRPIMMTTMAAFFGGLPLAFGYGNGSELRRPLGITIVGGLLVSQVLTLYTTPVVYIFFDRLAMRFRRRVNIGNVIEEPLPRGIACLSISGPFIRRPVATTLLTAAVALAGILAFQYLPVAPVPQVEYPTINIHANLPGASPEVMASAVATPLSANSAVSLG